MININGANKVINLFVHNPIRFARKPEVVQMFTEDIGTKLKYALALNGDAITLSTQAHKAAQRIAELKSKIADLGNGNLYTYEDFAKGCPNMSEDFILYAWNRILLQCPKLSKEQLRCSKEIDKCFEPENMRKIVFFRNLNSEEQILLQSLNDKCQLIPVLTGHKPAFYGGIKGGVIDFAKAIKGTTYENTFTAINSSKNLSNFTIINKAKLRKIIENNKEIYCRELGLDMNTSIDDIYKKWLYCIEHECPTEEKPLAFGLMLGYPKYSSLIYSLENNFIPKTELYETLCIAKRVDIAQYRDTLLRAIRHKDSPLKNYSEEFKKDIEHYIRTEDLRDYSSLDRENFYYQCSIYGSESSHMEKVAKEQTDFVNNFRMEQLF